MVIKTGFRQKRPTNPRPRPSPYGGLYEAGKAMAQYYGTYEQFKQYDPGYYADKYVKKYTYKPGKRVAGYLGQKLHEKKRRFFKTSTSRRFYEKCSRNSTKHWSNCNQ